MIRSSATYDQQVAPPLPMPFFPLACFNERGLRVFDYTRDPERVLWWCLLVTVTSFLQRNSSCQPCRTLSAERSLADFLRWASYPRSKDPKCKIQRADEAKQRRNTH
eukprot:scaffold6834_cov113-Skeletonema_dohrnii-CCMP3373.AAC.6